MMERKNGMRLPAVVLLAALAFSCFAPAALATAEEPPEDLPAAVSAQDGAQEETTLPGADAAQQDSAAGTGAANPHETIATSVQENPRFANRSWISRAATRSSFPSTPATSCMKKSRMPRCPWRLSPRS